MKTKGWRRSSNGGNLAGVNSGRLKYYIHDHAGMFRLQLLGSLTRLDVPEIEGCWETAESSVSGRAIQVDIRLLTAVDEAGEDWLLSMARIGSVEFVASPQSARFVPENSAKTIETAGHGSGLGSQLQKLMAAVRSTSQTDVPSGEARPMALKLDSAETEVSPS